jgi:uncharacterized membrane protein
MAGTIIIAAGCLRGLASLVRGGATRSALRGCRLLLADAVLAGLGFKVAATLLKTIELRRWDQIAAFAAVLALRSFLKLALDRERQRLSDASKIAEHRKPRPVEAVRTGGDNALEEARPGSAGHLRRCSRHR